MATLLRMSVMFCAIGFGLLFVRIDLTAPKDNLAYITQFIVGAYQANSSSPQQWDDDEIAKNAFWECYDKHQDVSLC